MEIERINEHTVKFYVSYGDIEERGFDRDEIWYNRERSEELFWEMMDEVHEEEDFMIEGPLWIQVQALDKGLEIIVTRAQLSKDGQKLELPIPEDGTEEDIESLVDQDYPKASSGSKDQKEEEIQLKFVIRFDDFEDLVSLSKTNTGSYENRLYAMDNTYYLYAEFDEQTDDEIENALSILLEYGHESKVSIHRLEEYGKEVMGELALYTIRKHFS
ncbi:adaptor protein MecA [Metabacillus sp. GX 13764]|uniref:adaptor protein MecA n=1 Tax=Metabacillus kandeliae TaxID=2900151 RepID=UPI001E372E0C|nr:adaptor protein MecA [Metabacillus kandeliae]MCD7034978.1 adaptor protein MecA [Metabacillus kandeliae]